MIAKNYNNSKILLDLFSRSCYDYVSTIEVTVMTNNVLKNRHVQMIALGGVIGSSFFWGTAQAINATGYSVIVAYLICGLAIYFIMRALSEMVYFYPCDGAWSYYAKKFVHPYFGFISSWNSWFEYTIVCMVDLNACALFIHNFLPSLPTWLISIPILLCAFLIQLTNVNLFGEIEFYSSLFKIIVILGIMILSAGLLCFDHNIQYNIGLYAPKILSKELLFSNGIHGFIYTIIVAMFSFGGIEFIAIAVANTKDPKSLIVQVTNSLIFRIIFFYVFTIIALLLLHPQAHIEGNNPFISVFQDINFHKSAIFMNIVAICASLSAFNSCLYASSRMLSHFMYENIESPSKTIVQKSNRKALYITLSVISIAIIMNYIFPEKAIFYLVIIATSSIIITWSTILISHIFYKKSELALTENPVKLKFFPYSMYFALGMMTFIFIAMFFMDDTRNSAIVTPIWILGLSIFYKICKRK